MKFIDTHCHPYLNKEKISSKVIEDFFSSGGEEMIIVGTDIKDSIKALKLAETDDRIFVTIGIHPCNVYDLDLKESITELENIYLENSKKIVGIGECGLDYYWLEKEVKDQNLNEEESKKNLEWKKQKQKELFKGQIALAKKLNLPLVIHNRNSKDDIFEILKETDFKNFVFHCYSENLEFAKKLLEFSPNCKISFSGILTFKNSLEVQETVKNIPIENILVETDEPYLTPVPYRGKEENEPSYTRFVVEKIAELRNDDLEKVGEIILKNSKETFKI